MGILLSLAMVVFPFSANISAATAVNVSVIPSSTSALQGGDFWVNLNVNSVDNLTRYWLDVSYNSAVIQVVGAENSTSVANGLIGTTPLGVTGWNYLPTPGTASGTIHINGTFGSGIAVSGTGYLARIHFSVIGAGGQSSSITPANVSLWSFNGTTDVPLTVGSVETGTISVTYPPVIVTIETPGEVSSGDDFVARINISSVVNLAAYQLVLSYNPAVIQVIGGDQNNPEGVTRGLVGSTIFPLDQWGYFPDDTPGTMIILGHLPEARQTSGSGYLAEIHFHVTGAQGTQSNISFTTVATGFSKLFDNTGTKMTGVVWTNTSVNIISPYRITNTSPLPTGEVGRYYSQTLGAVNGVYPYTFDVASGTLPAGLSLTPAGQISGTPTTAAGASVITFRVTDSTSVQMTKRLSMTIVAQPIITTTSPLTGGSATAYYNHSLSVSGGLAPFTWTVTAGVLPTGLSLTSAGVILGTPTVAGEISNFTVTVVDVLGGSAGANFSITISAGPVISGGSTLANGELGVAYSQTLVATGGTQPYSWAQIGGTLPPGLSFAAGTFSGTPTTAGGPYTFTIQVSDGSGAFFNAVLNITIVGNPVITTISPLTTGEVNLAYSQQLVVSGGLSPYSWSVVQGNLPAGLTLNSAGLITGKPTVAISSASVTIQVTDAVQKFNQKNFFITTIAAPTITTATLPNAQISLNYSQLLVVTGGLSPCTWALQPGSSLPTGLTLTSNGLIFGVPTTLGGPITFGVKVTDSMGGFATAIYSITVVSGPVITNPSQLPTGEINILYSQTLNVDGGVFPYTWSRQSGAFPAGLTMSSGGIISGTPTSVGGPTNSDD